MKRELEEKARLLQLITDNMFDLVLLTDLQGNATFLGKSHEILGYDLEDLIGENVMNLVHPEEYDEVMEAFLSILQNREDGRRIEYRVRCRDGSYLWLETMGKVLTDETGEIKELLFSSRDITHQKREEEQLKTVIHSTQCFLETTADMDPHRIAEDMQRLTKASYVVFNRFDDNGLDFTTLALAGASDHLIQAAKLMGFNPVGKKWPHDPDRQAITQQKSLTTYHSLTALAGKDLPPRVVGLLEKTFDTGQMVIVNIMKSEKLMGHFALIMPKDTSLENPEMATLYATQVGLHLDRIEYMHQLRQEQNRLRDTKERLYSVLDYSHDAIHRFDHTNTITFVNQAYCQLVGGEKDQIIGRSLLEFVHPEEETSIKDHLEALKRTGAVRGYSNWLIDKEGNRRYFEWTDHPIRDHDGTILEYQSVGHDMTQRIEMEQQLVESEKTYREIFNSAVDALFIHDIYTGEILDVNDTALKTFGYTREEVPTLSVSALSGVDTHLVEEKAADLIKRCAAGEDLVFEWLCKRKNGETFPAENHLQRVTIAGKPRIMATVRDITERKQVEEALAQKTKLLEESQALANMGSWEWDMVKDTWHFSDQWKKVHGLAVNDLPTSKLIEIAYPEDAPYIEKAFTDAKELGKTYDIEHRIIRADNKEVRRIKALGKVEFDQNTGRPLRMVGSAQDITERVEKEENIRVQNSMITALHNSIPDLIFYKDQEGVYLGCNQAFAEYAGLPQKEIMGKTDYDLFDQAVADSYRYHDRQMLKQLSARLNEEWITYPDGKNVLLSTLKTPYWDQAGNLIGILGIGRDTTDRKKAEEKLQEYAQELEKKNMELDIAAYQAEEANQAKSRFVATMNHEIRTPINGLMGFLQILEETPLNQDQSTYLSYMNQSAQHLLSLVNNVLDMAKIEAGEMELDHQPFDLVETIDTALASLHPMAREKKLQLIVERDSRLPIQVKGDPLRLRQIILNLAGNAVKFTEKGSVRLKVDSLGSQEGKHQLHLEVQDTGPGMDQSTVNQLFQPFFQDRDNNPNHPGGTGLGLPITRELVERMDGRIHVHSTLGEGTTVILRFNLEEETDATEDPGQKEENKENAVIMPNKQILLVEDQEMNRTYVKRVLEKHGFVCDLAENGLQAVEKASHQPYDLILMDIQMPVMNGLEATRQIRSLEGIKQPQIVAMTAYAGPKDEEACLAAGMDVFLTKPIMTEDLVRIVKERDHE